MFQTQPTGDVELGRLGTLQIRTDVETVQHVDVSFFVTCCRVSYFSHVILQNIGPGVSFIDTKHDTTIMSARRSEEYERDSAHSFKANAL